MLRRGVTLPGPRSCLMNGFRRLWRPSLEKGGASYVCRDDAMSPDAPAERHRSSGDERSVTLSGSGVMGAVGQGEWEHGELRVRDPIATSDRAPSSRPAACGCAGREVAPVDGSLSGTCHDRRQPRHIADHADRRRHHRPPRPPRATAAGRGRGTEHRRPTECSLRHARRTRHVANERRSCCNCGTSWRSPCPQPLAQKRSMPSGTSWAFLVARTPRLRKARASKASGPPASLGLDRPPCAVHPCRCPLEWPISW